MAELAPPTLTSCDREPIHVPGEIQPHGVMLVLDDPDLRVLQCSANVAEVFGTTPEEALNRGAEALLPPAAYDRLVHAVLTQRINPGFSTEVEIATPRGDRRYDVIAHRSGSSFVVEFEPALDDAQSLRDLYGGIRHAAARIQLARDVDEVCRDAASAVRELTGYDRVLVYRFDENWDGRVVAEARAAHVDAFLGLHFPATDIPRQARELYRRNWLRLIPDVGYAPVPLVPERNPRDRAMTDLSLSVLRSVSPIHLQYLRNMGVAASMSVSLLKNGELWGLIACHNETPRYLPYPLRQACEFYGRTASMQISAREEGARYERSLALKSVHARLVEHVSLDEDLGFALTAEDPNVMDLVEAEGAAVRLDGRTLMLGRTPGPEAIERIVAWLVERTADDVFVTQDLAARDPAFADLDERTSGLLAVPLARASGDYVLWFRREQVVDVHWAGEPVKAAGPDDRLSPRTSFADWKQTVRRTSRPWLQVEIEAAVELQRVVAAVRGRRIEAFRRQNLELNRRNDELNVLAHVTSHDLKEPLRGVHNYATYLLEDYGGRLDAAGQNKLETLVALSLRLHALIDSLAQLARVSRIDFVSAPTDLAAVVADVVELYRPRLADGGVALTVAGPLPTVRGDRFWIGQIVGNLLSNALKYTDRERPVVEIGALPATDPGSATLYVRDDGIGMERDDASRVFSMFTRLHGVDAYGGGTGAGLAIAAKVAERLGGTLRAASEPGRGSTFYLTLPTATAGEA